MKLPKIQTLKKIVILETNLLEIDSSTASTLYVTAGIC